MTSACRLYRLSFILGCIAAGAIGVGLALAVQAVELEWSTVPPSASSWFVLVLLGLGVVVASRALVAIAREARAGLEIRRRLPVIGRGRCCGIGFHIVDDEVPQAFCSGLLAPRVCLSSGALAALNEPELRAVLVHERHHQRRRDPLRLMLLRVLGHALWCLPGFKVTAERYAALAELAADEAALAETGDNKSLARALLTFGSSGQPVGAVGIAPERVDQLFGRRPAWELPASVLVGSWLAVAMLAAVALLADAALYGDRVEVSVLSAAAFGSISVALGLFARRHTP